MLPTLLLLKVQPVTVSRKSLTIAPPPSFAELLENVQLVNVAVPPFSIAAPNAVAEFPANVLLVTVSRPTLSMAPPPLAELPVKVHEVTVTVPLLLSMPPPAPAPGAVPLAIVRPEIATVAPSTMNTRLELVPWTVRFDAPGPSIVTSSVRSGRADPSEIVPETAN